MKLSIFSFLLIGIFVFTSCQKNEIKQGDLIKGDYDEKDDWKEEDKWCFDFVYPVTLTMPNGCAHTVYNIDEMTNLPKTYDDKTPNFDVKPVIQFPVDILFKDFLSKTINSEDELLLAKKECEEEGGCFELGYPQTYVMVDGTAFSANNEEELKMAMTTWYDANSDSEEKPTLEYPVTITFKDGTAASIESETAMIQAKEDCDDDNG